MNIWRYAANIGDSRKITAFMGEFQVPALVAFPVLTEVLNMLFKKYVLPPPTKVHVHAQLVCHCVCDAKLYIY